MSVKMISMVFEGFPQGGSKMLVMLAMADFARDDGTHIWPSVPSLAAKVRLQDRQVRIVLRQLVRDGFLKVEKQGKGGTQLGTTHYSICTDKLDPKHSTPARQCTPTPASECTPQTPALECTPALQSADPCTAVRKPLRASAPNPLLTVKNHHHRAGASDHTPAPQHPLNPSGSGGGGEALRGEALQGAEPPAPPGEPAEQRDDASVAGRIHCGGMATVGSGGAKPMPHGSLERASAAVDDAEARRRESADKAMITAGIADPGTRSRIAALPTCTAGLVRRVERLAKEKAKANGATLGGGLLANAIETEARAIVYRQQEEHDAASTMVAGARIRMEAMATEERERAEARRAEERAIRIENAMYMMAIDALPTERAEAARSELIEANPNLKHLAKYEPRSPFWRGLIVAHLQIDVQPYRLEAEQVVDALPVQGVVEAAAPTHGSRQAVGK